MAISPDHFRYFVAAAGGFVTRNPAGGIDRIYEQSECDRFGVLVKGNATAFQVWAAASDGALMLLEVYTSSAPIAEQTASLVKLAGKWEIQFILTDGSFPPVTARAIRAAAEIPVKPATESGIDAAEVRLNAGLIHFRKSAHFLPDLEQALRRPDSEQTKALSIAAAYAARTAPLTVKQLAGDDTWKTIC